MIKLISVSGDRYDESLGNLLRMPSAETATVKNTVAEILQAVRERGDMAVIEFTNKFDSTTHANMESIEVSFEEMESALAGLDVLVKDALQTSIDRVRTYHEKQKVATGGGRDWSYEDTQGNKLGQLVRAMERVGIYVPGGKASYPSTVIMTAIPAIVAGVEEIVLMVPAPKNELSEVLLAAALLCGITKVFKVGGAQAIAALAYGTKTIPKVDKIVGPGNIYVATAKELVFGNVGIDMIAGPSEIVIVADSNINVDWLVMDMFAQAEHDELAQSILISTDMNLLQQVQLKLDEQVPLMARKDIISKSIDNRGALIHVESLEAAANLVNYIAPEHLELALADVESFLPLVKHAGAIFLGNHSAEVVGDYTAGPSHVLPTSGTARFASALGVYDFQVRSSIIDCSARGAIELSRAAAILAYEEGLEAHGKSAEFRVQG